MTITRELSHYDLVNLFCGRIVPYGDNPYTKFTGNQWSIEWEWDRSKVGKLSEEELAYILFGVKNELPRK
jgi:hypothetical protein